ncbi:MAG: hypothetical protein EBS49_08220 [Verrucomicrobia bacterium]|nr:hypothetical protein [Verrucomicrobiota bacterium]
MSNDINTYPIQQFIALVKNAEMSNQKNILIDIKVAKHLAFTLGEITSKMVQDYDTMLSKVTGDNNIIEVKMDGGGFK